MRGVSDEEAFCVFGFLSDVSYKDWIKGQLTKQQVMFCLLLFGI